MKVFDSHVNTANRVCCNCYITHILEMDVIDNKICFENVSSQCIASVRVTARANEVVNVWKPALDKVWEFVRARRLKVGHNLFLYKHPEQDRDDPMDICFGVQVVDAFEGNGVVECITTPSGKVVSATHFGPYRNLRHTHDSIHAWCKKTGEHIGGYSWEIYGDHVDNEAKLQVTVKYLLQ
jgi:effector-binding domain-containing protein